VLRGHQGVKDCVVVAKEDQSNNKRLVAYLLPSESYEKESVINYLQGKLPEYMVPGVLVEMEQFPLTVNGKLDKRALPEPEFISEQAYKGPVSSVEKVISKIWEEVLGVERISMTDNFFRIGGDSILSIQVSGRIRQAGYNCQVKDIFEYKTIALLAEHVGNNQSVGASIKSEQGLLTGEVGLLPIQEWFTEQVSGGRLPVANHWDQSFLVRVPQLDVSRLEGVVRELVSYHDALRIRFRRGEVWSQEYQSSIVLPGVKRLDVRGRSELELEGMLTEWQSGFDIEKGPMFQVGYLYGYEDGSARIYFALHHLIVDGVSWRILAQDLRVLYGGGKLPVKGSSYRQWVAAVSGYGVEHPEEAAYWKSQLGGESFYISNAARSLSTQSVFELDES
jgi:aryl carrier-like protein